MRTLPSLALALSMTAMGSAQVTAQSTDLDPDAGPTSKVVPKSEVKWEQLNPARGDKSPKAGTLWGDRTGRGPGGFLLKPLDGFRSPPHIHNIAYRGVVISGLIHNDDPKAVDMWMPKGSFWTQPAGEVHITAAKGRNTLAYIEVEGAFGVLPANKAFANKERPVNVDVSNIVWLDASDTTWVDQPGTPASSDGPKMAFLWGNPQDGQLNGTFVKLPAGFSSELRSNGSSLRAVVIQGQTSHQLSGESDVSNLEPGSYFGSTGETVHQVSCEADDACIIYVRTEGKFDVIPAQSKK
ncbi:MAG: DUF4437 domain-containing protein [Alphaproteobacteria bacterium]|nr:DUF4437 domain-containing protein [Alphaproteobacteria bacterium]